MIVVCKLDACDYKYIHVYYCAGKLQTMDSLLQKLKADDHRYVHTYLSSLHVANWRDLLRTCTCIHTYVCTYAYILCQMLLWLSEVACI